MVGAVATGLFVLAMSNPAAAAESDNAAWSDAPTGDRTCITVGNLTATACFKPYGDVIYVQDLSPDANEVYAYWQNQLRDSTGTWGTYRSGTCTYTGGAYGWGSCNKDFYEHSSSNAWGGQGSRVRVKACVNDLGDDTCSSLTVWVNNQ
ncbi:hypothetical protein [Streptomyces sp. PSKA30]|uniref:hypothetical protein n=1 Tax=Streptomyces sp. PSKA30 TaxID=2874597 RepID=UPI001CD1393B|nr:hypothetical protein [Streptomyces sp. PSKA30]MBZ9643309.1 hypothetical protein [Streptomyces sp. PSKA30]